MSWSYRIVEDKHGGLSIREVYYDDAGVVESWSADGMAPYGETMAELNSDFSMMQDAFYEPVLKAAGNSLEEHPVYIKRTEVK